MCPDTDVYCFNLNKEEYEYLENVINGLIDIDKKLPKKFRSEKSKILFQIKEKYFT